MKGKSCLFGSCPAKQAVFEGNAADIAKHLKTHRLSLAGKTACPCRLPDDTACEFRVSDKAAKLVAHTKKTSADMTAHLERDHGLLHVNNDTAQVCSVHQRWLLGEVMLEEHNSQHVAAPLSVSAGESPPPHFEAIICPWCLQDETLPMSVRGQQGSSNQPAQLRQGLRPRRAPRVPRLPLHARAAKHPRACDSSSPQVRPLSQ